MRLVDTAIVGGGAAGLYAARELLANACDVVLFEKNSSTGGNARAFVHRTVPVDTGVMFFKPKKYPILHSFLKSNGLGSATFSTSTALFLNEQSARLHPVKNILYAARSAVKLGHFTALSWFRQFSSGIPRGANRILPILESMGLAQEARYLLGAGICGLISCEYAHLSQIDTEYLKGGLASIGAYSGGFHRIEGGVHAYLAALRRGLESVIQCDSEVSALKKHEHGYVLHLSNGTALATREVILAVPPSRAARLSACVEQPIATALSYWPTSRVDVTVFEAESAADRRATWTHYVDTQRAHPNIGTVVDMGSFHGLDSASVSPQVLINPGGAAAIGIRGRQVVGLQHEVAIPTTEARRTLEFLRASRQKGGPILAGAYLGWGSHEDALQSGAEAAREALRRLI